MREKKYEWNLFMLYNKTGIETHLEKMARRGWMLEGTTANGRWIYRRTEPREVHFTVAYFPKAAPSDQDHTEELETFYAFCARTGWKLVVSAYQLQIFYSEEQDPIPIETDPAMAVESIHASVKRNGIFPTAVSLSVMCLNISTALRVLNGSYGASTMQWIVILAGLVMLLLVAGDIWSYCRWHSRAKAAAAQGEFLEPPNTTKFDRAIWLVLLALCGYLVLDIVVFHPVRRRLWGLLAVLSFGLAVVLLVDGFLALSKKGHKGKALRNILLAAAFLVGVTWVLFWASGQGMF